MITKSTQRVFIPFMMMAFLLVGAFAAQAQDYRSGDRVAKGAVIGAAVGTLFQMMQGRGEGHQLLKGAVVGGALGAAVGATQEGQYGRWDGNDYRDGYYQQDGVYYQSGYAYPEAYVYPQGYVYRNGYDYRGGHDGYRNEGYYRDSRPAGRYDHDRDDHRSPRRNGDRHDRR
jgi:hypothetical protein